LGQKNEMPAQISSLEGIKIVQIGCGECHSVALSDKGEVYSWGGGGVHKNFG
jgi:alpha-tubulin suppressor-like RCC1 family protein